MTNLENTATGVVVLPVPECGNVWPKASRHAEHVCRCGRPKGHPFESRRPHVCECGKTWRPS